MTRYGPGGVLLHPVHLVALAVLGLNDHWLKDAWPGVVSGKLSDVAGLIVLPIAVIACAELLSRRTVEASAVAVIGVGCAAGFAAVQVWPAATRLYAGGLGGVQWVLTGAVGPPQPVVVTPDVTDLLVLPMALVPLLLHGAQRGQPGARPCPGPTPPAGCGRATHRARRQRWQRQDPRRPPPRCAAGAAGRPPGRGVLRSALGCPRRRRRSRRGSRCSSGRRRGSSTATTPPH